MYQTLYVCPYMSKTFPLIDRLRACCFMGLEHVCFMRPTLKKLKGHIALGLSVRTYVCQFKTKLGRIWRFLKWIPHQKELICIFLV